MPSVRLGWHGVGGWWRQDLEALVSVLVGVGRVGAALQAWRGWTGASGRLDYGTKAKIDFIKSLKIDFRVCGHLINVSFMISDTGCTTCMHHISTCAFEGGHFIICEILS
jgi:hypothetical protein